MSEQELYDIARSRVRQRNRRWSIWAVNLGVLILTLAALILLQSTLAAGIFMAWAAVFVVHTIIIGFAESSAGSIENEVARLRSAVYEKPKRLEISDDGELVDQEEWEQSNAQRSRNS